MLKPIMSALTMIMAVMVAFLVGCSSKNSDTENIGEALEDRLTEALDRPATLSAHGNENPYRTSQAPGPTYDFELPDTRGNKIYSRKLRSAEGVKLLLVDFFSIDCVKCVESMPEWTRIYNELKPQGFEMVVVNVILDPSNSQSERTRSRAFFDRNKVPFPVACDLYRRTVEPYKLIPPGGKKIELPHVFLFNPQGELLRDFPPPVNMSEVRRELDARLKPETKAPSATPPGSSN